MREIQTRNSSWTRGILKERQRRKWRRRMRKRQARDILSTTWLLFQPLLNPTPWYLPFHGVASHLSVDLPDNLLSGDFSTPYFPRSFKRIPKNCVKENAQKGRIRRLRWIDVLTNSCQTSSITNLIEMYDTSYVSHFY